MVTSRIIASFFSITLSSLPLILNSSGDVKKKVLFVSVFPFNYSKQITLSEDKLNIIIRKGN